LEPFVKINYAYEDGMDVVNQLTIPAELGWEIAVMRDRDIDTLIAGVLEAVDRWLAACDLPSTRIRIDDHTFLVHRPAVRLG
jgi:hypothetical protein